MAKKILLSFDVEEFDILREYGQVLQRKTEMNVSLKGLKNLVNLLDKLNIKATFFVTANFAMHNQKLIKKLSRNYEIASHGLVHSSFEIKDLKISKKSIETIIGKKIKGFRMPKLKKCNEEDIADAGYLYNSSMNPTFIPGRYNNFFKKRVAYRSVDSFLFNIPISVTPLIRFPLFWLSFKNLPLFIIKILSRINLSTDKYLNIYFHPWEFTDISKFNLPFYIKKDSGEKMLNKLKKYLLWLKKQGRFISYENFVYNYPCI